MNKVEIETERISVNGKSLFQRSYSYSSDGEMTIHGILFDEELWKEVSKDGKVTIPKENIEIKSMKYTGIKIPMKESVV